jgi:hypothetical protein
MEIEMCVFEVVAKEKRAEILVRCLWRHQQPSHVEESCKDQTDVEIMMELRCWNSETCNPIELQLSMVT